jgi:signal peptidase I
MNVKDLIAVLKTMYKYREVKSVTIVLARTPTHDTETYTYVRTPTYDG